tara:strand:+ start:726 stop:2354 length:1629 start_codon:yes stop_codon:yes gene_type:complete
MVLKNSFNFINEFLFYSVDQIRKIYLNSTFYNKKISNIDDKSLEYKPSTSILSCIINYEKKKEKIEDFYINSIWTKKNIREKDYKKLHNFFWLFTIDLKSSKNITQKIIMNWIKSNYNYNPNNWEIDILSKRIISWISNSKLTYDEGDLEYKKKFNYIVKKQINHLINEINRSELIDDKMIGCTAIILSGLSYNDKNYLNYGLNLLNKIIKFSLNSEVFPKSRSIKQLIFYLKYFILIRELLKESQNEIPEYLNEVIFYLGQAYNFLWQTTKKDFLFNGNHENDHANFDNYLNNHHYKFKNISNEIGGYAILRNKNVSIAMDLGTPPEKKFSYNYQSGVLSFEMIYSGKKLITNSGYFQDFKHQLNNISKSTAAHSTLTLDNNSICNFRRNNKGKPVVEKGFKILSKNVALEKELWSLKGSHNGYQKKYGVIHDRELNFFPEINKLVGKDTILKKKNFKSTNFEIRFHLIPEAKITKTQDGKAILIELENSGWKFNCEDHLIDVETGLYFGKKNSYVENKNIFISGRTINEEQVIEWEIKKI